MSDREGVIKYRLQHRHCAFPQTINFSELNAWRTLLLKLGLVGQDANRYQGLGFGNLSQRLQDGECRFMITGTQTGHLACLHAAAFAIVEAASPLDNRIMSFGPVQPSSEALTHASVYQHHARAKVVIHVHSPELWRQTLRLQLPHTRADIAYGSVEMAKAVEELLLSGQLDTLPLFSMLGHEDGIVAFGSSFASTTNTLLTQLSRALMFELEINAV